MSHCHLDAKFIFPLTKKTKSQILQPNYALSETTNKIIQSVKETLKTKKANTNNQYHCRGFSSQKQKQLNSVNSLQLMKRNNAKSPNRFLSPITTYIPCGISKTPKHGSVSIKTSNHTYQLINAKVALDRKKQNEKKINYKHLANSNSFHGPKPKRFKLAGRTTKEANSLLLTSSSFTLKTPKINSLIKPSVRDNYKNEINVIKVALKSNASSNINYKRSSYIKEKLNDNNMIPNNIKKDVSPLNCIKNVFNTPINSPKNKYSSSINTKADVTSCYTEKIYMNQLNDNNTASLKLDDTITRKYINQEKEEISTSLKRVFIINNSLDSTKKSITNYYRSIKSQFRL